MQSRLTSAILLATLITSPLVSAHGDGNSRFMRFFDSNNDGIVTQEEFQAAMRNRFQRMDTDHDGTVSRQEFAAYLKQRRQEHKQARIEAMDQNKDGQVSKSEFLAYQAKKAEQRFAKLDRNQDGVLGADELDHLGWRGHRRHNGQGLFKRLDSNGDGVISAEENSNAAAAWFSKLDSNGDKQISADELKAFRMHRHGRTTDQ